MTYCYEVTLTDITTKSQIVTSGCWWGEPTVTITVTLNLTLSDIYKNNISNCDIFRLLVGRTHCDYLRTALPFAIINLAELERC